MCEKYYLVWCKNEEFYIYLSEQNWFLHMDKKVWFDFQWYNYSRERKYMDVSFLYVVIQPSNMTKFSTIPTWEYLNNSNNRTKGLSNDKTINMKQIWQCNQFNHNHLLASLCSGKRECVCVYIFVNIQLSLYLWQ